jgi:hypothetical protein
MPLKMGKPDAPLPILDGKGREKSGILHAHPKVPIRSVSPQRDPLKKAHFPERYDCFSLGDFTAVNVLEPSRKNQRISLPAFRRCPERPTPVLSFEEGSIAPIPEFLNGSEWSGEGHSANQNKAAKTCRQSPCGLNPTVHTPPSA